MADLPLSSVYLIFSHILPLIMGLFAIFLVANGVMDKKMEYTIGGVALFLFAAIFPFLALPFVLGT